MKRLLMGLAVSTSALLGAIPVSAQDTGGTIDDLFHWAGEATPGCSVAAAHRGERVVEGAYGMADLGGGVSFTSGTRVDIGSLQKQFVAAAVLLLAEEGRISLTDDVRKHVPELPDYGHAITVDHLLTHTSGIRDWTGLLRLSGESEDALTLILRQRGLNHAPGEEWMYTNSGYVLLKEMIVRASGMSVSEFVRDRLFEPLGMDRTLFAEDVREVEDRAMAYEKEGDDWRLAILVGDDRGDGGAILSTAADLLAWNEALSSARLGAFVTDKLHERTRLNNGRELSYGRGLFVEEEDGRRVVWHTGSAAGYKSTLIRVPGQAFSLAILCNAGDSSQRERVANALIDRFAPRPSARVAVTDDAAGASGAEGLDLSGRAGLYFSEHTGEPLRLMARNGMVGIAGGPRLVPLADDRFRSAEPSLGFLSDAEFELRFQSPDRLVVTTMEGETIAYRRAEAYAPTAAELAAFVGRYESEELGSVLEVVTGERGLAMRLNGSPPAPFVAVDRDTFQLSRMFVRFRRDGDGRVVGFDYSNPVLRPVTFVRTTEISETRGSR